VLELDVPVSVLPLLVVAVPDPETEPEPVAEPEIEPDALTLVLEVSAGAVVVELDAALLSDFVAWLLVLLLLELAAGALAEEVSLVDVEWLLFVSTEQPAPKVSAIAARAGAAIRVSMGFFMSMASQVWSDESLTENSEAALP
jgi:hypothetical protein